MSKVNYETPLCLLVPIGAMQVVCVSVNSTIEDLTESEELNGLFV